MAVTTISKEHALAMRQWSKTIAVETSKALRISNLIGTSDSSIIQEKTETNKSGGDSVTFGLRAQLMGMGVTEGQVLEGNEESLQFMHDKVVINELYNAVRVKYDTSIDQQRFAGDLRSQTKNAIVDWLANRMSIMFFIQVCGYTAPKILCAGRELDVAPVVYGFNAPTEPTDERVIRPDNKSKDEDLTDAAKHSFNLKMVDQAVEMAQLANPRIRPVRVGGDEVYVLYLHPTQVTALRTNTEPGQWLDIQKAVYATTRKDNPIYDGSLGMYNNVILRSHEHVTCGVHSSTKAIQKDVRRAVFLGAQSAVIAFGKGSSDTRYRLTEEFFDYRREYGLSVSTMIGIKKTRFQLPRGGEGLQDYGTIVISTYAKTK